MSEPTLPTHKPARPASTLILLRDSPNGVEVFMLRRGETAAFFGGAYVFPGGAVDAADSEPATLQHITGLTEAEANQRLSLSSGALAYWMAAARECFEEAGIVMAVHSDGEPLSRDRLEAIGAQRDALNRSEVSFTELLACHGCAVPAHNIAYLDHWITPPIRPKRFDTRFFIARAPVDQEGSHDNAETIHSVWMRPADALAQAKQGSIELALPTRTILQGLAEFACVDDALKHASTNTDIEGKRPIFAQGKDGQKLFRLGDAAYYEVHWTDPNETMATTYDLTPDVPKRLDRWVTRLIAPNPGMMTGPGTNTYVLGTDELAVIDPGPMIESHIQAILDLGAQSIRWILCTHTHRDHSPAAIALKRATGAQIIGYPAPAGQDETFVPDRIPSHDERLQLGGMTLRVLHTPGHASNHLCYLLEQTKMLSYTMPCNRAVLFSSAMCVETRAML